MHTYIVQYENKGGSWGRMRLTATDAASARYKAVSCEFVKQIGSITELIDDSEIENNREQWGRKWGHL